MFSILPLQGAIVVSFTNQADFDAYNFITNQSYIVHLDNDTTLPITDQINSLQPLSSMDSLVLFLNHTLVENLYELQQPLESFYLAMEGNEKFDTLYITDNIKVLSISCERTFLKYIYGGSKIKQGGTFYIYDNDYLKKVELDLGDMDASPQGYPSLEVAQNDSLKTFYWNNPHHQLSAFSFFENRQLKHVHLETAKEKVSSMSEAFGGFVFNIELDSISGCVGLDSVHSLIIKQNYMLDNACVFQNGVKNYLIDYPQSNFFIVENNAIGLKSLTDLLAADCSWLPNGVEELKHQKLSLYPNPAHNEVFVEQSQNQTTFQIYDMSGKIVATGFVESNGRVSLAGISGGMYILQVAEKRSKLVIQ